MFGGNPNLTIDVPIANDTGSNVQTLFDTDLSALQCDQLGYNGFLGGASVELAFGSMQCDMALIELQIIDENGLQITPWFSETAIIKAEELGAVRLSGEAMRNYLYFATAPGNNRLYISQKKKLALLLDFQWFRGVGTGGMSRWRTGTTMSRRSSLLVLSYTISAVLHY